MDSIAEKIDDFEVEIDTIKDYVTESANTLETKLETSDKKKDEMINALEQRIETLEREQAEQVVQLELKTQALEKERNDQLAKLEKRIEDLERDSVVVRPSASNFGDWLVDEYMIPQEISDLAPAWQERLSDFVVTPSSGERLTKAQLAFFTYHIQTNRDELGYGAALVDRMIQEGVKERFWYTSWKPEEVSDFRSYLLEKVKSARRKEKRRRTAEDLERRANMKKKSC